MVKTEMEISQMRRKKVGHLGDELIEESNSYSAF